MIKSEWSDKDENQKQNINNYVYITKISVLSFFCHYQFLQWDHVDVRYLHARVGSSTLFNEVLELSPLRMVSQSRS